MGEITTTVGTAVPRQLHIKKARITCVGGRDQGKSWLLEGDTIRIGTKPNNDIVLTDDTVSRRHAEILRERDGVLLKDIQSTNGSYVGPVKIREAYLMPETRFRVGQTELVFAKVDEVIDILPSLESNFEGIIGGSMVMRELFGFLERVAATQLTVLVTGATGTGKELVSRAIHKRSQVVNGPFEVFDCGAVSETLIESELFGHERGAFTGAVASRPGVFELADTGTVFLDEIGELPLDLQPKLLRVLEQREVRRVGAGKSREVDVRVIAATNRDLREEVAAGRFREDLYYRLAVVEIHIPPLSDRPEDIRMLVDYFLKNAPHNPGVVGFSPEVQEIFDSYHWPGNVRELKNVVERSIPFNDGPLITIQSLPEALKAGTKVVNLTQNSDSSDYGDLPFKDAKDKIIESFEKGYLLDLLEKHQGNVSKVARAAHMDRKSVTRLMKKHEITR